MRPRRPLLLVEVAWRRAVASDGVPRGRLEGGALRSRPSRLGGCGPLAAPSQAAWTGRRAQGGAEHHGCRCGRTEAVLLHRGLRRPHPRPPHHPRCTTWRSFTYRSLSSSTARHEGLVRARLGRVPVNVRPILNMKDRILARNARHPEESARHRQGYKGLALGRAHGDGISRSEVPTSGCSSSDCERVRGVKARSIPGRCSNPGKIVRAPKDG